MSTSHHPSENVTTRGLCCPQEKTEAAFGPCSTSCRVPGVSSFVHAGHPVLGTLCWLQGGSVAGRAVEALSSWRLCLKVETDKKSSHQTQVITNLIKSPEEKQDVDAEQRRLM